MNAHMKVMEISGPLSWGCNGAS